MAQELITKLGLIPMINHNHKSIYLYILLVFNISSCNDSGDHSDKNIKNLNFRIDTFYLEDSYYIVGVDGIGNKVGRANFFDYDDYKIGQGFYLENQSNGLFYRFSKNGNIVSVIHKINGEFHGVYEQYSKNGKLQVAGLYLNNKRNGEWICYDTTTNLISSREYFVNDINVGANYYYSKHLGKLDSIIMQGFEGYKGKINIDSGGGIKISGEPYLAYFEKTLVVAEESDITILVPNIPNHFSNCECLELSNPRKEKLFPTYEIGTSKYEYKFSFDKQGIHIIQCIININFESGETLYKDTLSIDFHID